MPEVVASAERIINAPAERVYGYIRDYREHHPRILPPAFSPLQIEGGGLGAGTVFRVAITAAGRTRRYHLVVAEPEPGRVLTESDLDSSLVTTFTVTPEGARCRARIESRWQGASGIGGFFERLFAPLPAGRLFAAELRRLDQYARWQAVRQQGAR